MDDNLQFCDPCYIPAHTELIEFSTNNDNNSMHYTNISYHKYDYPIYALIKCSYNTNNIKTYSIYYNNKEYIVDAKNIYRIKND